MSKIILYNICLIKNEKDEILVQKRFRGMKGFSFPGGKINPDESIEESVCREVLEETGLQVITKHFVSTVSFYDSVLDERTQVFLFKCDKFQGELIRENDEGLFFWCCLDDFLELQHVDGMNEFIKAYNNESFEWHYNE